MPRKQKTKKRIFKRGGQTKSTGHASNPNAEAASQPPSLGIADHPSVEAVAHPSKQGEGSRKEAEEGPRSFEEALRGAFDRAENAKTKKPHTSVHSVELMNTQPTNLMDTTDSKVKLRVMSSSGAIRTYTRKGVVVDGRRHPSKDDVAIPIAVARRDKRLDVLQVFFKCEDLEGIDVGGDRPLHIACAMGHIEIVKLLIKHGADVNVRSNNGYTPLLAAVSKNRAEIARYLIDHGAAVDGKDAGGETPLSLACDLGHLETAEILLEHGANINASYNGREPMAVTIRDDGFDRDDASLHALVVRGMYEAAKKSIEAGADPNKPAENGMMPLHAACESDDVRIMKLLLDAGADAAVRNTQTEALPLEIVLRQDGVSSSVRCRKIEALLEHGASFGDVDIRFATHICLELIEHNKHRELKLLLESGHPADLLTQSPDGVPLLVKAAQKGCIKIGKLLLSNGADIGAGCITPLHTAIVQGHHAFVEFLLKRGATIGPRRRSEAGHTVMHLAALHLLRNGGVDRDMLEVLIKNGIDVDSVDIHGNTALHAAASEGKPDVVEVLIQLGASIEIRNNDARTPLFLACAEGKQIAATELIRKAQADLCTRDDRGANVLTVAVSNGDEGMVRFLLSEGIPVDLPGVDDVTALMLAVRSDRMAIAKALLVAGADVHWISSMKDSPLHRAIVDGNNNAVELLLQHGADPHLSVEDGATPLEIAKENGRTDVLALINSHVKTIKQKQESMSITYPPVIDQEENEAGGESSIEQLLTCPITLDVMRDPVVAPDGYCYDREAITAWLNAHGTSPLTLQPMTVKSLTKNRALKFFIEMRIKGQP